MNRGKIMDVTRSGDDQEWKIIEFSRLHKESKQQRDKNVASVRDAETKRRRDNREKNTTKNMMLDFVLVSLSTL
jgi:Fic family protein